MAVEKATKPKSVTPTARPLGWKERWGTYAQWVVAAVAIVGLYMGIRNQEVAHDEQDFNYRVDGRIDGKIEPIKSKLDEHSEKLANMEGKLDTLIGFQKEGLLKGIASQDQKTFPKSLPVLRTLIESPPSAQFKPNPSTLVQIAEELRNTPETSPDYWPTVLQFIQFVSAGLSPDVPPRGEPTLSFSNNRGLWSGQGPHLLSHEVVLLDGGDLYNLHFQNCRIIFTEHPVRMVHVSFTNCVFEMPITSDPAPYLKNAARQLLASNLTSVSIPAP
jgi:hypothetical protein